LDKNDNTALLSINGLNKMIIDQKNINSSIEHHKMTILSVNLINIVRAKITFLLLLKLNQKIFMQDMYSVFGLRKIIIQEIITKVFCLKIIEAKKNKL
jgi:hypothetical protein